MKYNKPQFFSSEESLIEDMNKRASTAQEESEKISKEMGNLNEQIWGHSDRMIETMTALGFHGVEINGKMIQPPATGTFFLLEAIDNIFATGEDRDYRLSEVAEALFVMDCGADIAKQIAGIVRAKRAVEKTKSMAEKSPEFYQVYLNNLQQLEAEFGAFSADAAAWIENFGNFNVIEVASQITDQLNIARQGFAMFPQEKDKEEKKKVITPSSTLPEESSLLHRLCRAVRLVFNR